MGAPLDPHPLLQDYADPSSLVSAQWLSARLGTPGLKVVESDEDSLLYDIGHIAGAVRIDWKKDLNDSVMRDYISSQDFAELMNEKGIARDDTVVIYGDKHNWWAAFTFWVFKLFGHEDVRLLNGGRDAWMAEERETSFMVPDYPSANYPVVEREDVKIRAFVEDVRDERPTRAILDVRSVEEYEGRETEYTPTTGVLRRGHIPHAINIPWDNSVHPNSRFRSKEELKELFKDELSKDEIITYCHSGERAAHAWFVLKYLLGHENVRAYDGSWIEWGNMVRMPITKADV